MENIVGSFCLKTFGGKVYKFCVLDNGLMYCNDITMYPLYRIVLKPLFDLYGLNEYGMKKSVFIPRSKVNDYIESVNIDENLLNYMILNNISLIVLVAQTNLVRRKHFGRVAYVNAE